MVENTVYPGKRQGRGDRFGCAVLRPDSGILNESSVYRNMCHPLRHWFHYRDLKFSGSGIIDGLVTYDQFSQGYLSIKKAVEAIHAGRQKQETLLDLVYLDQQELASGVYEKMLYPME